VVRDPVNRLNGWLREADANHNALTSRLILQRG
jgi:hypothetical protein